MDLKSPIFIQLNKENINGKDIRRFRVDEISFHRLLQPKDIISVEVMGISNINPGDFVFGQDAYSKEGLFQVIKKTQEDKETILIIDGYNLYFNDQLYPKDLIGKLVLIQRNRRCLRFDTPVFKIKRNIVIGLSALKGKLIKAIRFIQGNKSCLYFIKKIILRTKINYQIANLEDIPQIARLFAMNYWPMPLKLVRKKIFHLFNEMDGKGYYFVARKKQKIVGIIVVKQGYSADNLPTFWYADMLYIDFFYRGFGIGRDLTLFFLCEGIRRNIRDFRGISIKKKYEYAKHINGSLNFDKFGKLNVEENKLVGDNSTVYVRLNYIFKITRPEFFLESVNK